MNRSSENFKNVDSGSKNALFKPGEKGIKGIFLKSSKHLPWTTPSILLSGTISEKP